MTPLLIAHRGDSAHAPENTLPAFEQAVEKGADWIEMDLTLARDDEVVVSHDFSLWRRARSRRRLRDLSADDLARVDVSRDFPTFSPTGVPRLKEVLAEVGTRVPLYLELKSQGQGRRRTENRRLLERCLRLVPRSSPHALASFDTGLVRGALEAKRRAILILSNPASLTRLNPAQRHALYAVSVRYDLISTVFVERLLEKGKRIWVWTVDDPRQVKYALKRGAHGVCGNDVAKIKVALRHTRGV